MKIKIYIILLLFLSTFAAGCNQKAFSPSDNTVQIQSDSIHEAAKKTLLEKGYNLPVDEKKSAEAKNDCKEKMKLVEDIYASVNAGNEEHDLISDETMEMMQDRLKEANVSVSTTKIYSNMENYENMTEFLENSIAGKDGQCVVYEICSDGGIRRSEYIFDGTEMYLLDSRASWNRENKSTVTYVSYTRLKEWDYTDKGWFCYELCVPEPPEVTEVVDGSCMLRVKPMKEEYRKISQKCLLSLAYKGNNILCSNWDADHLENLDYNGVFEYLYGMKYQENFPADNYANGIPKEEFETVIMEYIPVTAEQIQEYAVYDEVTNTYAWSGIGCLNYAPNSFGTSVPEVVDIKENEDSTVTLMVDAICERMSNQEAIITHELRIRFEENGEFQYLGNRILGDGVEKIPDYQYRIARE